RARSARDDQLDDGRFGSRGAGFDLLAEQRPARRGDRKASATQQKAVEVIAEPAYPPAAARQRPERAVAVGEPAISRIDAARLTVDERNLLHAEPLRTRRSLRARAGRKAAQAKRLNASVPFVPPKPKEFEIATSSLASRASFGV